VALDLSANVGFAYAAPQSGISTKAARSVLPDHVSHATAVRHLGLVISLVRGLATADPQLIRIGVEDDLHVPHRLAMIENGDAARSAGYDAGAWAVTISGAGSGLIAICPLDRAEAIADAMQRTFSRSNGEDAVGFAVRPDLDGLTRL
jgi:homoserine kinase